MSADASTSTAQPPSDSKADPTPTPDAQPTTTTTTATEGKGKEPEETNEEMRVRLDNGRKELRNWLERKKKVDRDLASLEVSIHAFEGSYLSDALLASSNAGTGGQFGNIIKGYDSYLKAPAGGSSGALGGSDRKRGANKEELKESERMFSNSSGSYKKALESRHPSLPSSQSATPDLLNTPTNLRRSIGGQSTREDEDEESEEEDSGNGGSGREKRRRHR